MFSFVLICDDFRKSFPNRGLSDWLPPHQWYFMNLQNYYCPTVYSVKVMEY